MGFIFLPFCYFLYCVISFCYRFLLLQGGEGGVDFFFHFLIIISYILNEIKKKLFEGRKGA
jgi:hypothetical protein